MAHANEQEGCLRSIFKQNNKSGKNITKIPFAGLKASRVLRAMSLSKQTVLWGSNPSVIFLKFI